MLQSISKSISLLFFLVVIVCGIYPLTVWLVGQTIFPFQANGSVLLDADGKPVGSELIAQPFSKDEYFQPRPSAASYDATASASSALAASNYALRDRVARSIGPVAKYPNGLSVAPDIEQWFQQDRFQTKPNIVGIWAAAHNALAVAWVNADATHGTYVDNWAKTHPAIVAQFVKNNPGTPQPKAADLAVVFFQNFAMENPGKFPLAVNNTIPSIFFDMWREEHPDVVLQDVPGDFVTTSGSGLDPNITLQNAEFQLDRVAAKWASDLKRNPVEMKNEIQQIVMQHVDAPLGGLLGERFINVLVVNLELRKRYGLPQ